MNAQPDDPTETPPPDVRGFSAGWVVALVIFLTLTLGATFFAIAHSLPLDLIER